MYQYQHGTLLNNSIGVTFNLYNSVGVTLDLYNSVGMTPDQYIISIPSQAIFPVMIHSIIISNAKRLITTPNFHINTE